MRDIIVKCGGEDFPRVRIGVGSPPHEDYDMADWVLSKPVGEDAKVIKEAVKTAATAIEKMIIRGVDQTMAEYN